MPKITLTKEQESEFSTPELAAFALAYLAFQHSSPCTQVQSSYQYFTAPDEAHANEDDILFGPDREHAYKELMLRFTDCRKKKSFFLFFDAAHNQYYESQTIPGLVILKEWSTIQSIAPGLYTGSFRDIRAEDYDEIWICVRSLKSMPKNPLGNIKHVQILSPSKELWLDYLAWKKAGNWNHDTFERLYAPRFLKEMLMAAPYRTLQELERLTRTKSVLVVCYCSDESLCHRSLLKRIISQMRIPVQTA